MTGDEKDAYKIQWKEHLPIIEIEDLVFFPFVRMQNNPFL